MQDDPTGPPPDLALDTRPGLPEDLRFLLARYPRDDWQGHGNLGEMARFWLARHDMFRELAGTLGSTTTEFREGRIAPEVFARWFTPRLSFFLSQLNAHHHIEDEHYFPIFRAAEAKLGRGFTLLDADHEAIHHAIEATAERANAVLGALEPSMTDQLRRAADHYADASGKLVHGLLRHLQDEEDLIIPLILDRGEAKLGVG
jgi:iron-sulfur cluster repair protein YtfE (RIC family)